MGNGADKTTVYVSTFEGSAYDDDYIAIDKLHVEFKATDSVQTVTVNAVVIV